MCVQSAAPGSPTWSCSGKKSYHSEVSSPLHLSGETELHGPGSSSITLVDGLLVLGTWYVLLGAHMGPGSRGNEYILRVRPQHSGPASVTLGK